MRIYTNKDCDPVNKNQANDSDHYYELLSVAVANQGLINNIEFKLHLYYGIGETNVN